VRLFEFGRVSGREGLLCFLEDVNSQYELGRIEHFLRDSSPAPLLRRMWKWTKTNKLQGLVRDSEKVRKAPQKIKSGAVSPALSSNRTLDISFKSPLST
jgi:hypothetical protein